MRMFRKAQAAMEFLMTYGWAILVVLVVIGALAYFGVLSPSTLLPEKCTFPIQISCSDHSVSTNAVLSSAVNITLVLQNGAGRDMIIHDITATGDTLIDPSTGAAQTCGLYLSQKPFTFNNNQRVAFDIANETSATPTNDCDFTSQGRDKDKYDVVIDYSWADSQNINHQFQGELFAAGP